VAKQDKIWSNGGKLTGFLALLAVLLLPGADTGLAEAADGGPATGVLCIPKPIWVFPKSAMTPDQLEHSAPPGDQRRRVDTRYRVRIDGGDVLELSREWTRIELDMTAQHELVVVNREGRRLLTPLRFTFSKGSPLILLHEGFYGESWWVRPAGKRETARCMKP